MEEDLARLNADRTDATVARDMAAAASKAAADATDFQKKSDIKMAELAAAKSKKMLKAVMHQTIQFLRMKLSMSLLHNDIKECNYLYNIIFKKHSFPLR